MVYVTGDTHGDFTKLYDLDAGNDDFVIICGDFGGIWDGSENDAEKLDKLSKKPFTTLFADGNHENFDLLYRYPVSVWRGGKVHRINERVIHLMRGQIYEIEGKSFFTMGGGLCHDITGGVYERDDPDLESISADLKKRGLPFRINHISWWKEELPSDEEYKEASDNLAKRGNKVDYIITHAAPTPIQDVYSPFPFEKDRLTDFLQTLRCTVDFGHWYFGHYHKDDEYDEKFTILFDKIIKI
ncbi:MAG: metallophosphoesterase [Clostridia bacterium]|nr:metallophosphoesterase [Clostridia bacterium]